MPRGNSTFIGSRLSFRRAYSYRDLLLSFDTNRTTRSLFGFRHFNRIHAATALSDRIQIHPAISSENHSIILQFDHWVH